MWEAINDFMFNGARSRPPTMAQKRVRHPAWAERKSVLTTRLKDLLVFELSMTGDRTFKSMTPRGLYDYVLAALATRPSAGFADSRRTVVAPIDEGNEDMDGSLEFDLVSGIEGSHQRPSKTSKLRKARFMAGIHKDIQHNHPHSITHRERLGGYLHPRDMRRLVTPFSATNEPELIVRRHVMLLNMDPLRAIVLRDRLLVLVPNGADSILEQLEKRVSGGSKEMENSVFDDDTDRLTETKPLINGNASSAQKQDEFYSVHQNHTTNVTKGSKESFIETESESEDDAQEEEDDEWLEMNKRDWIDMPFELQSVDAVLHVVCTMLFEEANELQEVALDSMDSLLNGNSRPSGDEHSHDVLRQLKNDMSQISSRVVGFTRALNLVLDDDEDLALMNLSRLVTHPERFILPVSDKVLHEESDEPELILEGYLQQALSTLNALDSVKSQLNTTEELMNMKLDAVRNRLLYINTVTAFITLIVTIGSFVGSIFGMNLYNGWEDSPNTWNQVVFGTLGGGALLFVLMMYSFVKAASVPSFH